MDQEKDLRKGDRLGLRPPLALGLSLLLLAATSPLARGQDLATLPAAAGRLQAGPVEIFPSIYLRDIGVDSNVFNEAESSEAKSDFTMTVNPRLRAVMPIGAARLTGTASVGVVRYQTYQDQRSSNHAVDGRVDFPDTQIRPFIEVSGRRTRERSGLEIDRRALHSTTSLLGGTDVGLTPMTTLTVWVRQDTLRYGEGERYLGADLARELDRNTTVVAAGTKLALTPLTTLTLALEMQRDRFAGSSLRDTGSLQFAPTLEFDPTAIVAGRVSVGLRRVSPRSLQLPVYQGLVASASTRLRVVGGTTYDVNIARDIGYSLDAGDPLFLSSGGGLTVTQRLVGPIELIGTGQWHRLRYQTVGGALLDGRAEITRSVGVGLGVWLGEFVRATVTYDRTRRTSTETVDRHYDRRRLLASLDYGL